MGRPKGTIPPKAGIGRQKGVPNKITMEIRQMILMALDNAGGVEYLTEQARANPGAFMALLGKILPTQITGKDGGPVGLVTADAEAFVAMLTPQQKRMAAKMRLRDDYGS